MNFLGWLKKWDFEKLKINAEFLELEVKFTNADKLASWELYVELLTRITTQELLSEDGDEKTALTSVFSIFSITRDILKRQGPKCIEFTKIAIIVLNQIIRPFTAKWHGILVKGELKGDKSVEFRTELSVLQIDLRKYTHLLSDIAGVEDLTKLEIQK